MKKLIIGCAALVGVLALRQVTKHGGRAMREHCEQMAGHCREMMGAHAECGAEASRMSRHCGSTAVPDEEPSEPVAAV
jgi:hypothetical protein